MYRKFSDKIRKSCKLFEKATKRLRKNNEAVKLSTDLSSLSQTASSGRSSTNSNNEKVFPRRTKSICNRENINGVYDILNCPNYKNWLKVAISLRCACEAIAPLVDEILIDYHLKLRQKLKWDDETENWSLKYKNIESARNHAIRVVLQQSNRAMTPAEVRRRSDVSKWSSEDGPWEIAKVFMPFGQKDPQTIVSASSFDSTGLFNLIISCKLFEDIVSDTTKVQLLLQSRNKTMHNPQLSFTRNEMELCIHNVLNVLNDPLLYSKIRQYQGSEDWIERICSIRDEEFDISSSVNASLSVLGNKPIEISMPVESSGRGLPNLIDCENVVNGDKVIFKLKQLENFIEKYQENIRVEVGLMQRKEKILNRRLEFLRRRLVSQKESEDNAFYDFEEVATTKNRRKRKKKKKNKRKNANEKNSHSYSNFSLKLSKSFFRGRKPKGGKNKQKSSCIELEEGNSLICDGSVFNLKEICKSKSSTDAYTPKNIERANFNFNRSVNQNIPGPSGLTSMDGGQISETRKRKNILSLNGPQRKVFKLSNQWIQAARSYSSFSEQHSVGFYQAKLRLYLVAQGHHTSLKYTDCIEPGSKLQSSVSFKCNYVVTSSSHQQSAIAAEEDAARNALFKLGVKISEMSKASILLEICCGMKGEKAPKYRTVRESGNCFVAVVQIHDPWSLFQLQDKKEKNSNIVVQTSCALDESRETMELNCASMALTEASALAVNIDPKLAIINYCWGLGGTMPIYTFAKNINPPVCIMTSYLRKNVDYVNLEENLELNRLEDNGNGIEWATSSAPVCDPTRAKELAAELLANKLMINIDDYCYSPDSQYPYQYALSQYAETWGYDLPQYHVFKIIPEIEQQSTYFSSISSPVFSKVISEISTVGESGCGTVQEARESAAKKALIAMGLEINKSI